MFSADELCSIQVSYADCCEIVAACKTAGVVLAVCHVLRYLPQARKIAQLIQSGYIGDVVNIQHTEPVSSFADIELSVCSRDCLISVLCTVITVFVSKWCLSWLLWSVADDFVSVLIIIINNNNNQRQCLWCCHRDHGHCESSPGSFDECRLSAGWPPTLRPSQPTWAMSPPINGCYHPHPPSPFVIITQPES